MNAPVADHHTPAGRRSLGRVARHRVARAVATAAMGAWILLAVTPVVVVICAIR
ncbi:hypothetical protein KGY14_05685 [Ameyamaea chiangmaiensis]|uniref:Uncharacterized protein n=1 Tax=Ameyamaea chiangmaiensis TaxID=442969 RepID=A0A850PDH4_9PROT|nr:hypothetical protein [Ameyamaea chiangmaiensis]MBS4074680.1 hypothetical protein [Ameyamaea chiangmaiensis]NVN42058.1 hypothetical protein [Ameyamaea chiangmaiensis]